jgi:acetyl-CoA acyltransferase
LKNVYIINPKRTAIGNFAGALSNYRVDDLLARVLRDVTQLSQINPELIDDVIVGCANQAGEDNRNIARMSTLLAGLPETVPGTTINRLCGSSLDAIMDGVGRISAGFAECLLVGGAESMSRAPYVMSKAQNNFDRNQKMWDTSIGWRFPNTQMEKMFPLLGMGETAEEVQKKYKITRQEQDQYALSSHQKAIKAQKAGFFDDEITPIEITAKKEKIIFKQDEGPRADTNLDKLSQLKPAFVNGGTVTAGNSSSINDGAAAMMLVSEDFLKQHNLTPWARITGAAVAGLHPNIMGLGPIFATKKLCEKFQINIKQFDLVELNEAFAVQAIACMKDLALDPEIVNRQGGAIALGHPLGCSGARIISTMLHQMKRDHTIKQGLATMCIGVGQGIALSVENCF